MMKIQNVMEDYVLQKVDEVWDSLDCCKCDECKKDVVSLALNRLKPRYVSTELGKTLVKLNTMDSQFEIDILSALYEAAAVVKQHPHHTQQ